MVKVAYAVAVFLFFFLLMLLYGGIAPSFWNKRIETNYYEHKKEFAELMKFLQNKTSITIDDTVHKEFSSIIMYDWEVTKAMDKDNNHISKSNLTLTPRQQGLQDSLKYFLDKINSYDLYCEKTHIGGKVATLTFHDEFGFHPWLYLIFPDNKIPKNKRDSYSTLPLWEEHWLDEHVAWGTEKWN